MGLLRRSKRGPDEIAAVVAEFELPSFPAAMAEALRELADPEVDLRRVAQILERDPGLSVHFLRVANSAAMGLRSSVDSLDRAVAMLGRNQVESILIGRAVSGSLASTSPLIEPTRFWTTAATRAVVASEIAVRLDPPRRSEHFTAGLLQDMALLVLSSQVPGYDDVLAGWYAGDVAELATAEHEAFGWDHAEIAAGMCREWNFPARLVEAVDTHHDGDDPRSPSQLVSDWHEVDDGRGPESFSARAATVDDLAPHATEILEESVGQAAEVAAAFT